MGVGLELYGLRKDGTEVPVYISLSPLRFGDVFSVLGAIRDITERRSLQERERAARAEAVLTKIDRELNGLTRLIGELLDITQMETSHLP